MRHVDHAEGDVEAVVRLEVVLKLNNLVVLVRGLVRPLLPLVSELEVEHDVANVGADALLTVHDVKLETVVLLEEFVSQELTDRWPEIT